MRVVLSILCVIAVLVGILALCRWLMLYRSGEEHYSDIKDKGPIETSGFNNGSVFSEI